MAKAPVAATANANDAEQKKLLGILVNSSTLSPSDLRSLLVAMDNFDVVAKVFLLEGVPFVFASSPMKYLIFREQVADASRSAIKMFASSAARSSGSAPHLIGSAGPLRKRPTLTW
jgi:hypothetical protein